MEVLKVLDGRGPKTKHLVDIDINARQKKGSLRYLTISRIFKMP